MKHIKATINFAGMPLTGVIRRSPYAASCAAGLLMDGEDGEPYAVLSTNIGPQAANHVAIKDYSENEGVLASLVAAGIVRDTGKRVASGFVQIPICEIIAPELREDQ